MTGKQRKLYKRILQGRCDANLSFERVRRLLLALGYEERIESSHHVFTRRGLDRPISLQDGGGGECKPYQVRLIRKALGGGISGGVVHLPPPRQHLIHPSA